MYPTESSKERRRYGLYKCGFCGTEFKANTQSILSGNTTSCGCYKKRRIKETNTKHGLHSNKLYNIWGEIKRRTLNPKHKNYNDYGGRGITICEEWLDVQNFYDWAMSNGYEENKGLSIDRIDNDGNYSPENCRWVTQTVQTRNQRIYKNNTSGYRGVSFNKSLNKYIAQISINKKRIHLGCYKTKEEGAIAYNNYIIENNLEGFILNEIP
jgi:predicted  nucleic acid-binding Zn-ribbon protein